ncbi:hypothetical protein HQ346_17320 [Rhodococcus sp. BP-252]|uniref:Uncharacterized protein n=1 Tax=Rhodococcoides kyotonense TaxID=398843 RepID=A0A177Y7Z6_9NOCA|nr:MULTISPECIES: hypothetical protein [Rhodococcus]MBY6413459.1 hypothetical protein [Rhodococcus sp. BP-320]MBY6418153.1 hypothetical protein [Rhodococcus sp. BP-321]MBY6422366.1 hypothetical protein [Rhodococcus sp. BP-324]MBY6428653.1 hypothetical protein [Rhodococcus sp. BP-323]MBY6433659.1 hypothetical protein [Rhodococcus sp. BP-322]
MTDTDHTHPDEQADSADPSTVDTEQGADTAESDVQSDPAEGTDSGDWSGEGGATPDGPATKTE